MSDRKPAPGSLDVLTNLITELAREIGAMDPDDPKRASLVKYLSDLVQLRFSIRSESSELIGQRMDELTREMATLKPGDPRRAEIVHEIIRLSDVL